jgi:tryptophan aminotransferase
VRFRLLFSLDDVVTDVVVIRVAITLFQSLNCEMIGKFSFDYFPLTLTCFVEIETDSDGIKSSSLRFILETWPVGKPRPKILYTVPVRVLYFRTEM